MRITITSLFFITIFHFSTISQDSGMYFGPKGGLSLATQNWDGYDRNLLLANHIALFTESLDYEFKGSVYAQIGYHTRGSSIRRISFNGFNFSEGFRFYNASLQLGLKKRFDQPGKYIPYYNVGVRLEYNISTNLSDFDSNVNLFYPNDVYVNKWTYGISFGGGFEYEMSEFVIPFVELSFHPDLSQQYRSPPLSGGNNPWTGQTVSVGERKIRNVTMEISVGIKFLRKVTYTD